MGYTHYWNFERNKSMNAEQAESAHQQAVKECTKVLKTLKREGMRLSGYSANSTKQYGGLKVNGAQDNGCEDFVIREHFSQNIEQNGDFCKTAMREYDSAVVACLAILKYRLKDCFSVSSDGNAEDFQHGVDLASRILRRKIKNPLGQVTKTSERKAA